MVFPLRTPVFANRNLQPPTRVRIDLIDVLAVDGIMLGGTQRVELTLRVLKDDGSIDHFQYVFLKGDFALNLLQLVPLTSGYLLAATCRLTGGALDNTADNWIRVGLARQAVSGAFYTQILMQGYLTNASRLAWPNGRIMQQEEGAPSIRMLDANPGGAGLEINVIPRGFCNWRVMGFSGAFTTSAAAGNREVQFIIFDGVRRYFSSGANTAQAPGTQLGYTVGNFGAAALIGNSPSIGAIWRAVPWPEHLWFRNPAAFRTTTVGLDVADAWSGCGVIVQEIQNTFQ